MVKYDAIIMEEKFPDRFSDDIKINLLDGSNLEVIVRDKLRRNCIQIHLNELDLCWDLDENEEIDFIDKTSDISVDSYVRTGYVHRITDLKNRSKPIGYDAYN